MPGEHVTSIRRREHDDGTVTFVITTLVISDILEYEVWMEKEVREPQYEWAEQGEQHLVFSVHGDGQHTLDATGIRQQHDDMNLFWHVEHTDQVKLEAGDYEDDNWYVPCWITHSTDPDSGDDPNPEVHITINHNITDILFSSQEVAAHAPVVQDPPPELPGDHVLFIERSRTEQCRVVTLNMEFHAIEWWDYEVHLNLDEDDEDGANQLRVYIVNGHGRELQEGKRLVWHTEHNDQVMLVDANFEGDDWYLPNTI